MNHNFAPVKSFFFQFPEENKIMYVNHLTKMFSREEKKQLDLQNLPFASRTEEQRHNRKMYRYQSCERAEAYYCPKPFLLRDSDCQDLDAILRFKSTAAPSIDNSLKSQNPTISDLVKEKEKVMMKRPISPKRLADRLNASTHARAERSPRKNRSNQAIDRK
ncbi:hypothetical protein TRFO_33888 [Tritrichomonas foetus]|uniref:Uncharacterized protein n=1 Tax=Tritrichomonas foetus TaxID=1144522 RepID=A0A1J4JKE9_9EUKA|nr:hypothetical protein TRFO_33888 [Tritrichomonas foetus]|eukprot:OHS99602.1 hypothetical protein TRFO_33888 [Tritrichomonas foetus]